MSPIFLKICLKLDYIYDKFENRFFVENASNYLESASLFLNKTLIFNNVNNVKSDLIKLDQDVPQSTELGPIFSIFT